jgi:phospholipid-binding lipoprotein MlaA
LAVVGFGVALGAASVAAAQPPASAPSRDDPYETLNRKLYSQSIVADKRFFLPLARVYHALTPGLIGVAIHNVVTNLSEPVVIFNDILQARLKWAGRDTLRLTANSLAGFGGIMDVAGKAGLPHRDNDFGVTLGVWGARPGPYLFLPFVGPSTVRDAIGKGVDGVMAPLNYIRFPGRLTLNISSQAVGALDERIRSQGDMDALLSSAADPYATLRSVYLQSREAEVRGETAPILPDLDEGPPPPASTPDAAPPGNETAPPSSPSAEAAPAAPSAEQAARDAAYADPDLPIMTARPFDRENGPAQLAAAD